MQVAKCKIYLDPRLEQRLPFNSFAKGNAKTHRFYGAWDGPLPVYSDAIWRCRGPATFQQLSDKIIGPEMEPHAFSYLDDIIIVSDTFEEHMNWLEHVVTRNKDAGLTINRKKSVFCRSEVQFLYIYIYIYG